MSEDGPGLPRVLLHIGGEDLPARDGATYTLSSPATGAPVAEVADGGAADAARAAAAAARAFAEGSWRRLPGPARGETLARVAGLLEASRERLSRLECLCSGKAIRDCRAEVGAAARYFRYYAAAIDHMKGDTIPVNASGLDLTLREPVGVCALIVPWNGPLAIAAKKASAALAAGNSVVLKPAPPTPLTALELARMVEEAGVPPGVCNVLTGAGRELGRSLVQHPAVDQISFTGSTRTGADVLRNAADGIKRVSLELGGKSPSVVFADADLDELEESAVWAVFWNAGQDCCARSRLIVQRPVFDELVSRVASRAGRMRVGDPLDPEVEIGSLISGGQRDRVLGFLDRARDGGARIVCGGDVVTAPGLEAGNAIAPTVVEHTSATSEIATQEVFGPVATFIPFDTEEEAIAIANGTEYGLSASLWTRDLGRALRVSREIRSGLLSVNSDTSSYIQAPFGGRGRSGMGREQGIEGLLEFTDVKNVFISDH